MPAEGAGILQHVDPLSETLSLFFVQATIIIGITRILALLGVYLKQPRVIFEVIGGILLGPSAIGKNAYYLNRIFASSQLGYLSLVANIGLTLYLFIVGLELDPELLVTHGKKAAAIALVGMAVPFALGVAISSVLYDHLVPNKNTNIVGFFVFIGTAMSITAFPVLARILKETGLIYSRPGAMTMGAAALNDAVAWCLLILAISIANAGDMDVAGYVFLSVLAVALGLFFLIRPIFVWLVTTVERWAVEARRNGDDSKASAMRGNLFAFTLVLVFMCAWTTNLLGVHAIFGSFLFGLIVPRDTRLFHDCNEHIEEFVMAIMLPLYFAISGELLSRQISTLTEIYYYVIISIFKYKKQLSFKKHKYAHVHIYRFEN